MQTKESITLADVINEITHARYNWKVSQMTERDLRNQISNAYSLALNYLDMLRQRIESLRIPYQPKEGLVAQYIRGINTTCNKILSREPIVSKKLP